jgi:hypothetical protein
MGKSNKREKVPQKKRYLGNKIVVPTKFYGKLAGKSNLMSGKVDGKIVEDANGMPLPFREIGVLRF